MKKIVGVFAVFLFSAIVVAPRTYAYEVGATSTNGVGSYNFGSSLQNLVSPFTGFINSLKWNNSATVNTNGTPGTTWPTVNLTPVIESTVQNTLSQWVSQFDNWLYGATGIQLSGIMTAILGAFLWAIGLAQQAVNWLLGVFH
jgi:hypothetical protein